MNLTISQLLDQGMRQQAAGQLREAEKSFREALRLNPNLVPALGNLGALLKNLGEPLAAIDCFQRIIKLEPRNAQAFHFLGLAYAAVGKREESLTALRTAVALNPNDAKSHVALAHRLRELGRLAEALGACQLAMRLNPLLGEAHNVAGWVLQSSGKTSEAIAEYRKTIELDSALVYAHSNMLLAMHYLEDLPPRELFEAHRAWAARFADVPKFEYRNEASPDRPLRIGYVSPDMREHAVAYFLEPILASHDRANFIVYCYSDVTAPDEMTIRLRRHAAHWRETGPMNHAQLAQRIHEDQIDILVDCAGHTGSNRLEVFAQKPAPIQVNYIGYPSSSGLDAMDYWITDELIDPPGEAESLAVEELIRLPRSFTCYRPPQGAPSPGPAPTVARGHVTFGCFNMLAKLNDRVVDLWARILKEAPNARLLLMTGALRDPEVKQQMIQRFVARGIDASRLDVRGGDLMPAYLRAHHDVDIMLDPFPFTGHTVSLHGLWMGVPLVTLAGNSHVSRRGVSILTNLGLPELIARDADDYVRIAAELSRDLPRLIAYRSSLRARMQSSPLCDAVGVTRELEQAYRQMWKRWCDARN